jgi:hypothetical protein
MISPSSLIEIRTFSMALQTQTVAHTAHLAHTIVPLIHQVGLRTETTKRTMQMFFQNT